jgi:hypothetical protein
MENTLLTNTTKLEKILSIKNLKTEAIPFNGKNTGKFAVTDDEGELYGVVGNQYHPLAHGDFYAKVMEWLPEGKVVSCASSGFNGVSKAVINIEIPSTYEVDGQKVGVYVNLLNSLDGSTPEAIHVSLLRYACMNMFSLGKSYTSFIKISGRHTKKGLEVFNKQIPLIEQVYQAVNGQLEIAEKLAKMDITTAEGETFLKSIKEDKTLPKKMVEVAESLWKNPTRIEDEGRNAWVLFNAVTDPLNRKLEDKEQVLTFNQIMEVGNIFTKMVG